MIPSILTIQIKITAIILLLVAAAGCATPVHEPPHADQAQVAEVADRVQRIRQLKFITPVPLKIERRDQVAADAEKEILRIHSDEEIRSYSAAGAFLGLLPNQSDIKGQSLAFAQNYWMGHYDAQTKEMELITVGSVSALLNSRAGSMFLAHEFVHALQDQHFHLDRNLIHSNNTDRANAYRLVAEGDATIAEYGYQADKMDMSVLNDLLSNMDEVIKGKHLFDSKVIEGAAIARYESGIKFVGEAYRKGGWQAVDAIYANPPLSMHQLLHPADYFDHPRPPLQVLVAGYENPLPTWIPVMRDTYGEEPIRLILERNLGKKASEVDLAQAWAGDQVVILRAPDGKLGVIWMVSFVTLDSAKSFDAAYAKVLDKLMGETEHQVQRRDQTILVIAGMPLNGLAPSIWAESKVGPALTATSN